MQKIIPILTLVFVTVGCGQTDKKISENKDSFSAISVDMQQDAKTNLHDELLSNYIRKSDNVLIKSARQDTAIKIEWMLDRVEDADTAKYLIFHIGHDVVDEDNSNPRFVTDGWVYIDSLTSTLYEYDSPNDTLIKWDK